MKLLGVSWIISVSAVGSLQEEIVPGHIVLIDQFIDRTKSRDATFFEDGLVGHVGFSEPVCHTLHDYLVQSCKEAKVAFHERGTYVNMEGPAFSTVAESRLYRSWNAQVIGMTALTEAKLAREAEISWALIAMVDKINMMTNSVFYFKLLFVYLYVLGNYFNIYIFDHCKATDYDCWREGHDAVNVETVIETLLANVTKVHTSFIFDRDN